MHTVRWVTLLDYMVLNLGDLLLAVAFPLLDFWNENVEDFTLLSEYNSFHCLAILKRCLIFKERKSK